MTTGRILVPAFSSWQWGLLVGLVGLQAVMLVRAYGDAHAHFGYQPFNESSFWQARVERVDARGRAHSLEAGWFGYRWDDLVRDRVQRPFRWRRAQHGIRSTLVFMREALDWVAMHTPRDQHTRFLQATVTYRRNGGEVQRTRLQSIARK